MLLIAPNQKEDLAKYIKAQYEDAIKESAKYDAYWIAVCVNGKWQSRLYRRNKITAVDFAKAKEMVSSIENSEPPDEDEYDYDYEEEDDDDDEADEDEDVGQLEQVLAYYRFLASCYLKMTAQEFDNCDWGKIRLIIDACNWRTSHSLVSLSRGLYEFFHIDLTTHLTEQDYEMLRMYRLWIGKAKIKPWTINGGTIYEEDINTFLKLEEFHNSGEKLKAKKQEARGSVGNGSSVGADGVVHKRSTKYKNR